LILIDCIKIPVISQKILQKRINFLQYFFIQVADLVYHHRTKCGGYHLASGEYIITHQRVSICGIDDIQGFRLDFSKIVWYNLTDQ